MQFGSDATLEWRLVCFRVIVWFTGIYRFQLRNSLLQILKMGCCATKHDLKGGQEGNQQSPSKKSEHPEKTIPIDAEHQARPIDGQPQDFDSSPSHPLYVGELRKATLLFFQGKYAEAAEIYRNYIDLHPEERVEVIDGLGQVESSLGYYEWNLFSWYRGGVEKGDYVGTVYDVLSLCYLALKDDDEEMAKGIKWYQLAVDDYPQNHGLVFGLANILNNKCIYEQAIDYYNKALDLKPKWVRPLQCLAFIYQYKRIQKLKTRQICNKIMAIEPSNMIGGFILARSEANIDTRIQIYKGINSLYPSYSRVLNQIGIVYGGAKVDYEQSIKWYKQAIEVAPNYASCYNNIGVTYQMMKRYDLALEWYFRGIEKDREYKDPHKNVSDIIDKVKLTDQQIREEMAKYKVEADFFYYHVGLAYYEKGRLNVALKYYKMALEHQNKLTPSIYKLYNSMGIAYDELGDNGSALLFYNKSIESNPKYHSAYYNTAIVYKKMNKIPEAITWYKKAIEVNPRYSYAYNNLGNIYKSQLNYEEAAKCYKDAVEHNSTYTLALANMGICYMKLENYRQAFNAMERAQECLPNDNNNLTQANRTFLKEKLEMFQKEGENWRINGYITHDQKKILKGIIRSFQTNISRLYVSQGREPINIEKVLKPEVLEIVRLVHQDQFQLTQIDKIFDLIRAIFKDNEDYFHIIPQLFMQYFYKNTLTKQKPVLEIEQDLELIIKKMEARAVANVPNDENSEHKSRHTTFTLKHFQPQNRRINLFRNVKYFTHYAQIYSEIMAVHEAATRSYLDFKKIVDYVKKESYGILYGIGMKIPKDEKEQFKVILRIFQKMFKNEINQDRVNVIITKIDAAIRKKQERERSSRNIVLGDVVHQIMSVWIKEITDIVVQRKKKNIETVCEVSDLLRAKIMFETVDHLRDAIEAVDLMCFLKGYPIIEMNNRLTKSSTQDVVLKIHIKQAVCELQLALKQEECQYHFTHCVYEIERSPLGCIFGSYIFMSKGLKYPLIENCKDIIQHLESLNKQEDRATLQAARYIVSTLSEEPSKPT